MSSWSEDQRRSMRRILGLDVEADSREFECSACGSTSDVESAAIARFSVLSSVIGLGIDAVPSLIGVDHPWLEWLTVQIGLRPVDARVRAAAAVAFGIVEVRGGRALPASPLCEGCQHDRLGGRGPDVAEGRDDA
jgi:hypothetical protein